MDENPPDINGHRHEEKNKALCESIKLWRKKAWSWLKACFTVDNLKLFVKILIASSPIIGVFYFLIIEIKTDIQTTVTAVNQIDASITAAVSSMATSLSSANAKSDSQAIVHNNTFPLGSGNATIYHKFQNPVQACWYYAATYRTQHPYTVLWEKGFEDNDGNESKIRAVASNGVWKAHTCVKEKTDININKIEYLLRDGGTEENKVDKILQYLERNKTIDDSIEKIRKEIIRSISARITDNENQVESLLKTLLKKNHTEENKIKEILEEIREIPKKDEKIKIIRNEIGKRILKSISDFTDKDTNKIDVKKIESLLPLDELSDVKNKINEMKIPDKYTPIGTIRTEIAGNKNIFRIIQLITNPEPVVKLIGEETIVHRIEAKLPHPQYEDFKLIATTEATYNSAIHFDNDGSITHRRVKKADDYKCIIPAELTNEIKKEITEEIINERYCRFQEKKQESNEYEYKNELEIINDNEFNSPIVLKKAEKDYIKAFIFYLGERRKLHDDLTNEGCGAISVEPDFVTGDLPTGELETPSLVFLCHKNNIRSHVRIMVRENQQQKKERKDKAIQEEVKKREDEIRQEVKKETENKQSSEKQHKGSFLQKHFLLF